MKKFFYFFLILTFFNLAGCSSGDIREEIVSIDEPKSIIEVTMKPITEQELLDNALVGFSALIQNKSDEPITILWSDSTITYDGNTSSILLNPMTYEPLVGKIEPDIKIEPLSTETYKIYPSNNLNPIAQNKYYGPEFFAIRAGTPENPDKIILFLVLTYKGSYKFVRIEALTERVN